MDIIIFTGKAFYQPGYYGAEVPIANMEVCIQTEKTETQISNNPSDYWNSLRSHSNQVTTTKKSWSEIASGRTDQNGSFQIQLDVDQFPMAATGIKAILKCNEREIQFPDPAQTITYILAHLRGLVVEFPPLWADFPPPTSQFIVKGKVVNADDPSQEKVIEGAQVTILSCLTQVWEGVTDGEGKFEGDKVQCPSFGSLIASVKKDDKGAIISSLPIIPGQDTIDFSTIKLISMSTVLT